MVFNKGFLTGFILPGFRKEVFFLRGFEKGFFSGFFKKGFLQGFLTGDFNSGI